MITYRVATASASGLTSWGEQRTISLALQEFRHLRKRHPADDHRLSVGDTATCNHVDTRSMMSPVHPAPRTWCLLDEQALTVTEADRSAVTSY